ncbi:MAG: hypothetical protein ACOYN0_16410 [Phycisphaerales bacterium]
MARTSSWFIAAAAAAVVACAAQAQTTSTNTITLQAKVEGVADGTANVIVKFYDALTAGTQQGATITLNNQPITGGIINVPVSPVDPTVFNGQTRYMEVSVNGTVLSPRTLVTSVPYSLSSSRIWRDGNANVQYSPGGDLFATSAPEGSIQIYVPEQWSNTRVVLRQDAPSSSEPGLELSGGMQRAGDLPPNVVGARFFRLGGRTTSGVHTPTFGNAGSIDLVVDTVGPGNRYSSAIKFFVQPDSFTYAGASEQLAIRYGGVFLNGGLFFAADPNAYNLRLEPDTLVVRGYQLTLRTGPGGDMIRMVDDPTLPGIWCRRDISTPSLTIRGGSDLAEPFAASPGQAIEPKPGMILSIDPAHPGKLRVATEAYDAKVAGVYSGGNGLPIGMLMGKDGCDLTTGGADRLPVAMTGRVWVFADASNGVIKPGDRLTTSGDKPGHAMRATDAARCDGAVIGKAMTGVDDNGMVMVLVNLQ